MNPYVKNALHQIVVAIDTIIKIIDTLEDSDLMKRPTADKHSIGELLEHMAMICQADLLISDGASGDEMASFYSFYTLNNLQDIKEELMKNYSLLSERFNQFNERELHQKMTSYWGTVYTRFEWLLEISAHLYHHRGQLHAMLVHCYDKDPGVLMFE
ncbi:DinB family protein [Metabacillus idriensis]|uniref:DinB family protein n=1 Tax=Metabacillus idriensis TaxID=324768 RepID=UPI0008A84E40|nr:DinB family protein [Metabacillus idriensis]MCM3595968.1 DinB family protein [Metabacillus idriensis]OHR69813.1 damage-inducible protein DinB [Bacillus sp. HMSC76G11]